MSVYCPRCGHLYEGHENVWGKVCECGNVIEQEPPKFVQDNQQKLKLMQEKARKLLRDKLFRRT